MDRADATLQRDFARAQLGQATLHRMDFVATICAIFVVSGVIALGVTILLALFDGYPWLTKSALIMDAFLVLNLVCHTLSRYWIRSGSLRNAVISAIMIGIVPPVTWARFEIASLMLQAFAVGGAVWVAIDIHRAKRRAAQTPPGAQQQAVLAD